MPAGRPSIYTEELAEQICELIATSDKSMKTICKELDMKLFTVICWITESHPNYNEQFAKMYARAKDMQVEYMAEDIICISDDKSSDVLFVDDFGNKVENKEFVNRSKLRVDARKWIASKLKPKKYGDKLDLTNAGNKFENNIISVSIDEANAILSAIKDKI